MILGRRIPGHAQAAGRAVKAKLAAAAPGAWVWSSRTAISARATGRSPLTMERCGPVAVRLRRFQGCCLESYSSSRWHDWDKGCQGRETGVRGGRRCYQRRGNAILNPGAVRARSESREKKRTHSSNSRRLAGAGADRRGARRGASSILHRQYLEQEHPRGLPPSDKRLPGLARR